MRGLGLGSVLAFLQDQARHQLLLGDDAFVEQYKHEKQSEELREVSKAKRRSLALSLGAYQQRSQSRNEAMAQAYLSGAYTMAEIGDHFGVHLHDGEPSRATI